MVKGQKKKDIFFKKKILLVCYFLLFPVKYCMLKDIIVFKNAYTYFLKITTINSYTRKQWKK